MGWTFFFAPLFVFVSSGFAPSGAPLLVSCSFCFGALGGNGCGSPLLGLAFRSLVSLGSGLSWPLFAIARAVLVPFPCMGGQVGAYGSFCISLVSFFVIASFKFQARNLCFRFSVVVLAFWLVGSPWGFAHLPTFGLRASPFARIELSVSLRSTEFQFFFHKSKKKNLIPIK